MAQHPKELFVIYDEIYLEDPAEATVMDACFTKEGALESVKECANGWPGELIIVRYDVSPDDINELLNPEIIEQ